MLQPLGTLVARAKRQKRPLLSAVVRHLDMAVAVLRAAETLQRPIILTFDAVHSLTPKPQAVLSGMLAMAQSASVDCTVEVLSDAHHSSIDALLAAGAPVITPYDASLHEDELGVLHRWTEQRAKAYGSDVVLRIPPTYTLDQVQRICAQLQPLAVRTAHAHDLSLNGVAVIDDRLDLKPSTLRSLSAQVYTLDHVLEHSYVAGLRVGLRNREKNHTTEYLPPALLAVERAVVSYLENHP